MTVPRRGLLVIDSWAGRMRQHVEIVAETPKRYRIRAADGAKEVWLPGGRILKHGGMTALVPKHAVLLEDAR